MSSPSTPTNGKPERIQSECERTARICLATVAFGVVAVCIVYLVFLGLGTSYSFFAVLGAVVFAVSAVVAVPRRSTIEREVIALRRQIRQIDSNAALEAEHERLADERRYLNAKLRGDPDGCELFNLDLGSHEPPPFRVGPYLIRCRDDYGERLKDLSQLPKTEFGGAFGPDGFQPTQSRVPPVFGMSVSTATATCVEGKEPEAILVVTKGESGTWDLCQLLSYLSGQRVYRSEEAQRLHHQRHEQSIVQKWEIPAAATRSWPQIARFNTRSKKMALWIMLQVTMTSETEVRSLLASIAIECLIREPEFQPKKPVTNGKQTETEEQQHLSNLLRQLKEVVDGSGINESTKGNFKSAIGGWGPSGAFEKFKRSLQVVGVASCTITAKELERMQFAHKCRNSGAHGKDLPRPSWIADKAEALDFSIWFAAMFIPALARVFLNNLLDIESFDWPNDRKARIRAFFVEGRVPDVM